MTQPDIMVIMSQEAYNRCAHELTPGGTCISEEDLVRVFNLSPDQKIFAIPATRFQEELGKRMVVNSVMMGFFTSVTKLLSADALRRAVADSVPSSFRERNLKAFERGYEYGLNARAGAPPEFKEVRYAQE